MNVKELVLKKEFMREFKIDDLDDIFDVELHNADQSAFIELDRNQAHLLYLYLKERFEP